MYLAYHLRVAGVTQARHQMAFVAVIPRVEVFQFEDPFPSYVVCSGAVLGPVPAEHSFHGSEGHPRAGLVTADRCDCAVLCAHTVNQIYEK